MALREEKVIAKNRKAFHDYEVLETIEAGIELTGTEVCSLRENHCQLTDCFALIRKGRVWLHGLHIAPYSHGNIFNHDSDRSRRLLLHKNEIRRFSQRIKEQGLTLIPLKMYFSKNNLVKVELALCKGKKVYDKRQSIAAKDAKRDIERTMKSRYR